MRYLIISLLLVVSSPLSAFPSDLNPPITKFAFQGVHFGDFPSVDMICTGGLCPVGEVGVGISDNSALSPSYSHKTAITHYNGVKITTPEYSYFDDKMFMVKFSFDCLPNSKQECLSAIIDGLDSEYGLIPITDGSKNTSNHLGKFLTESGSRIILYKSNRKSVPMVKIYDPSLMDKLRISYNPEYVPLKVEILNSQKVEKQLAVEN